MYGDQGWYDYSPRTYDDGALELCTGRCRPEDRQRLPTTGWLAYLDGKDPGYPERALRADFGAIRRKVDGHAPGHDHARHPAGRRPDGVQPGDRRHAGPADARRHPARPDRVDPPLPGPLLRPERPARGPARGRRRPGRVDDRRRGDARPGQPQPGRAARRSSSRRAATASTSSPRSLHDGREVPVDRPEVTVHLAPGAGASLVFRMRRYANPPTLSFPWDRG